MSEPVTPQDGAGHCAFFAPGARLADSDSAVPEIKTAPLPSSRVADLHNDGRGNGAWPDHGLPPSPGALGYNSPRNSLVPSSRGSPPAPPVMPPPVRSTTFGMIATPAHNPHAHARVHEDLGFHHTQRGGGTQPSNPPIRPAQGGGGARESGPPQGRRQTTPAHALASSVRPTGSQTARHPR
jgi:hypothetical protein